MYVVGVDTGSTWNGLVLVAPDLSAPLGATLRNRATGADDLAGLAIDVRAMTDAVAAFMASVPSGAQAGLAVEAITAPQHLREAVDALRGLKTLAEVSAAMSRLLKKGWDMPALDQWLVPLAIAHGVAACFSGSVLVPPGGHGYRHKRHPGLEDWQCYPPELIGNRPPQWQALSHLVKGDPGYRRDEQAAYDVALKALGYALDVPTPLPTSQRRQLA